MSVSTQGGAQAVTRQRSSGGWVVAHRPSAWASRGWRPYEAGQFQSGAQAGPLVEMRVEQAPACVSCVWGFWFGAGPET